nr:unnamed protein product [Callosobruchus analis]
MLDASNFMTCYKNPKYELENLLSKSRLQKIEENRRRLKPIIKTIIFLGRQNIPLRGHRDDGPLFSDVDQDQYLNNEGNFRELLRFRVDAGDKELENHLLSTTARTTYISKRTQNELINCCKDEIRQTLVRKIKKSVYFAVIVDETTDISHTSQMSLIIRYLDLDRKEICEDFLAFIDCDSEILENQIITEPILSGQHLGDLVTKKLQEFGLDLNYCVSVFTDGCSVMISNQVGAVQQIQKSAPLAIRSACYNHALNLSLSKSSDVQAIRNCMGTIKEVVSFFTSSAKRNFVLKDIYGVLLISLCETRWVARHDAVLQFSSNLPKSSTKAIHLIAALRDCNFVVALFCLADVMSVTSPISKLFQSPKLTVEAACKALQSVSKVLEEKRKMCDNIFNDIFSDLIKFSEREELYMDFQLPRLTQRMRNRANPEVCNSAEYYKITIYIHLLDNITTDLKHRFDFNNIRLYYMNVCIPDIIIKSDESSIHEAAEYLSSNYKNLPGKPLALTKQSLLGELQVWKEFWLPECSNKEASGTASSAFDHCNQDMFPCLFTLLQIFCTIPVSVASSERSFSALRRIKSWIRARI